MANFRLDLKQINIDKEQKTTLLMIGAAALVILLALFFGFRLLNIKGTQAATIKTQAEQLKILDENLKSINSLKTEFDNFNKVQDELLPNQLVCAGKSPNDADAYKCIEEFDVDSFGNGNSFLVVRALPSEYNRSKIQSAIVNFEEKYYPGRMEMGVPEDPEPCKQSGGSIPGAKAYCFSLTVKKLESEKDILTLLQRIDYLMSPTSVVAITATYQHDDDASQLEGIEVKLRLEGYYNIPPEINATVESPEPEPETPPEEGS